MNPRYVVILAELVQDTAMSLGGNAGNGRLVDLPFCRDGRQRLTLRGESLAGTLIATARRLGYSAGQLAAVTGEPEQSGENTRRPAPSAWRPFTAHSGDNKTQARQRVRIDPATGADLTHSLRDMETTPRDTRWPFGLEIDLAAGEDAAGIAVAALREWAAGRCWLGRSIAAGTGWLHVANLEVFRLAQEDAWPSSRAPDKAEYLRSHFRHRGIGLDGIPAVRPEGSPLRYSQWRGLLRAGVRDDGYGLDALSIGGHAEDQLAASLDRDHFVAPRGVDAGRWRAEERLDTDFALVMAPGPGGPEPVIPGSSLRGALRHACRRRWRARFGEEARVNALSAALFGDELDGKPGKPRSSALLVADAHLVPDCDWRAAVLHQHAEDEFTAGVYANAKFDRSLLLQGCFAWRLVVEHPAEPEPEATVLEAMEDLRALLNRGGLGFLPVGGGRWRGAGWPVWTVTASPETKTEPMGETSHG